MLFIVRGSTDYAIKSFTIFFIFLEGVQIIPSNHLQCYLFLEGVQIMPSNHLQYYLFF
jgi:hypothetical protein